MNFNPHISDPLAVSLALLAPVLWTFWLVFLKSLGDYPLDAFYLTFYIAAMLFMWGLGFILDGRALIGNMQEIWAQDSFRVVGTLLCGLFFVVGMQLCLQVMQVIGLSLSQPIQSSINVVGGTLISALIGGIPQGMTVKRIVFSTLFFLLAILLTMKAGRLRNQAQDEKEVNTGLSRDPAEIRRALLLLAAGSALVPAYSTGLSYGLRSSTQPNGMEVMPFMVLMCTGSFIGVMLTCGVNLTRKKRWHIFREFRPKVLCLGILSGCGHYIGNIIHAIATGELSTVVSWPLGLTAGLWSQIWGLKNGEFKGAPISAFFFLGLGILCYLAGTFIIANIF